ncbi:MAG TPA: helix-turn-helix domain-containing protein [Woeseiaceae bacterium]|nr:helix-turn-helix domain-containing protein [Woeseiaceae bacterium]
MYQSYPVMTMRTRERFDYFVSLMDDLFCPMQCEARTATEQFSAAIETRTFGAISMANVSTSPVAASRNLRNIAHISSPPYLIKFQLRGESLWSQRGREVHLRPGDFVIGSTAEPYRLEFFGPYEMPVLAVPTETMKRLTTNPDQFLGRRMSRSDACCGLLSSFVAGVVPRMAELPQTMADRVETNILDLLGGVLSAHAESPVAAGPEQLLRQIKAFIARHLKDRRLGPAMIAHNFGISTRYVHVLFQQQPQTLARYIRSLRIKACHQSLSDPAYEHIGLTEIALSWGFYDLSHMTRCFRETYGLPPREFRRGGRLS